VLEDFAAQIAAGGTSESIEQVYDQYLNFVVSEPNLFSLGMGKDVYYTMNSAQTSDEEIDAKVDRIVSGLFSVAVTMGESRKCFCDSCADQLRFHSYHSMSKRRRSGDDCSQA
jgi:hypothetical protein